jgi:hypothetical protein
LDGRKDKTRDEEISDKGKGRATTADPSLGLPIAWMCDRGPRRAEAQDDMDVPVRQAVAFVRSLGQCERIGLREEGGD